jgi:hypothetical protein
MGGSGGGGWRSPHNEELHNLYSSPNVITVIKSRGDDMGGECSTHRIHEKYIQNKPEWKGPLGIGGEFLE